MFAKTMRLALDNLKQKYQYVSSLNQQLRDYFNTINRCVINSPENSSPYILNVSLLDYKPEVITHALEAKGIYISTKSACSTKKVSMARTLEAMGVDEEIGNSALRISFSHLTTKEDIDYFIKSLNEVLKTVKKRG